MNHDTRINSVFHVLTTVNFHWPQAVFCYRMRRWLYNRKPMNCTWCGVWGVSQYSVRGHEKPKLIGKGTDVFTAKQVPGG